MTSLLIISIGLKLSFDFIRFAYTYGELTAGIFKTVRFSGMVNCIQSSPNA